jgi:hypothetical protein
LDQTQAGAGFLGQELLPEKGTSPPEALVELMVMLVKLETAWLMAVVLDLVAEPA